MSNLERVVKLLSRRELSVSEVFERIRNVAEAMGCRAYLIGSWAEGRAVPSSDIDILVVCKDLPESMLER